MANSEVRKRSPHSLEFWFGKPVLVQLNQNYLWVQPGPVQEIPTVDKDGKDTTSRYAEPVPLVDENGKPQAGPCLPGKLYRDPICDERVILELRVDRIASEVSLRPKDIAFISAIPNPPEPEQPSSIVTP